MNRCPQAEHAPGGAGTAGPDSGGRSGRVGPAARWTAAEVETELSLLVKMAQSHGRVLRYGIGRDAHKAHVMLSNLGLMTAASDPSPATLMEPSKATTTGNKRSRTPSASTPANSAAMP